MRIITSGRNIELTEAIKNHVNEKVGRLSQHFDFIQEIHVFLSVEKNPSIKEKQLAEATVKVHGSVIRVSVAKEDLYASIDELADKIARSMKKHKTKLLHRTKTGYGSSIRKNELEMESGEHLENEAEEFEQKFSQESEETVYEVNDQDDLINIHFIEEEDKVEQEVASER